MNPTNHMIRLAAVTSLLLGLGPAMSFAQAPSQTFTATANMKTMAGAELTAPVTVVVTRQTTDSERTPLVDALKKGGRSPAIVALLKGMPDAGYIELAGTRTTLKYAYVRPIDGGRLVTVLTPTPIVHLRPGTPDAQPKTGFDLAVATFEVKDSGAGLGELAPAASVKANDTGAVVVDDYGLEVVRLTNVVKK